MSIFDCLWTVSSWLSGMSYGTVFGYKITSSLTNRILMSFVTQYRYIGLGVVQDYGMERQLFWQSDFLFRPQASKHSLFLTIGSASYGWSTTDVVISLYFCSVVIFLWLVYQLDIRQSFLVNAFQSLFARIRMHPCEIFVFFFLFNKSLNPWYIYLILLCS